MLDASPSIPTPPPQTILLLFAKWTKLGVPTPDVYDRRQGSHVYKLAIRPTEPVTIGRRVRILALTPIAHHRPCVPIEQYDTHNPHVVGVVTEIERRDGRSDGVEHAKQDTMIVKIKNECRGNAVARVLLETTRESLENASDRDRPAKGSREGARGAKAAGAGSSSNILLRAGKRKRPEETTQEGREDGLELLACVRPWPTDSLIECAGRSCVLQILPITY